MYEVIIKGKFTTGSTADTPDQAINQSVKVLEELLDKASLLKSNHIFQFKLDDVEANKL